MDAALGRLAVFAEPAARDGRDRLLPRLYGLSLLCFGACGLLLLTVKVVPVDRLPRPVAHRIAFVLPVPPPVELTEPQPASAPESEPETLTRQTILAQTVAQPAPVDEPPAAATSAPADAESPARRVYGVRKVFARGLGSGGGAATGLVTRRGNVLDGVVDTLTATAADLAVEPVSLATVESAPEPLHRVKPRYSEAMVAARASGTVSARLLVDTAGSVAAVEVTEDFGLDSRELAIEAFRQFRFRPALRDGRPVAVWIVHRIRFEFQE